MGKRMTSDINSLQQALGIKNAELKSKIELLTKADADIEKLKVSIAKLNSDQANDLQKSLNECSKLSEDINNLQQQLSFKNAELEGKSEQANVYLEQKKASDAQ